MSKQAELLAEIERLQEQLGLANKRIKTARYGIVWMDIPELFDENHKNQLPVLREVKEKAIKNGDGQPIHLLIEGDNYHALTCLNYTHKSLIDLIYIDPPYNTGSQQFSYQDQRILDKYPDGSEIPKDHPLRHSHWLSFMSKRLSIAHSLLKDDGAIFISINEEEHAQLKLLCDGIFQESNYLASFTIKIRHEDRILKGDKDFHETTEQLLLYRKSNKYKTIKRLQDNTSISEYVFEVEELTSCAHELIMGNKKVQVFKPDQYRIHKKKPSVKRLKKISIRGSIKEGNSSGRFYMANIDPLKHDLKVLYKVPAMGNDEIPYRYFLSPTSVNKQNGDYFQGVPMNRSDTKEVPYPNFIDFEEAFNNVGYEGGVTFRNGKKPVDFLKFVLKIGSLNKDAKVLDFFAGSGSTGHAVLEQNSIDGGRRQVILCTNNENKIAETITYPRIKNVINGYEANKNQKEILFELPLNPKSLKNNEAILEASEKFNSDEFRRRYDGIKEEVRKNKFIISGILKKQNKIKGLGNSLKYYKTDFIELKNDGAISENEKWILACKTGFLLAIKENTLEEMESTNYFQLFQNKEKALAIGFKETQAGIKLLIERLQQINKPLSLYLLGWKSNGHVKSQFDHIPNLTLKTMPSPISEIYKKIYTPTDH